MTTDSLDLELKNLEMNRSYQDRRLRRIANGQWQIANGAATGAGVGQVPFHVVNSAAAAPTRSDSAKEELK